MNENPLDKLRLAIHSTHEAAEKIAGIGAVLDGVLPQVSYQKVFPTTILVGPCAFPLGAHPLKEVYFDSAGKDAPIESSQLPCSSLLRTASTARASIRFEKA
jgi:hypothetical protein